MSRRAMWWQLRDHLGPQGRRRVRRIMDTTLAPLVGSIRSTRAADQVAITFDDGPEPSVTPFLLAALAEAEVKCTFFVLVGQCRRHPDLLKAIVDGGHEIALHGEDHRRITSMSHLAATKALRKARADLQSMSGSPVEFYRPPYGAQSLGSYLAARRAGMKVVVWSADAADWVDRAIVDVVATAFKRLAPGGILLLHERLEPDADHQAAPTTSFDRVDLVRRVLSSAAKDYQWRGDTVGRLVSVHGVKKSAWFRP